MKKNIFIYWLLQLTWGLPLTLIGFILTLILLPFSKLKRIGFTYCIILKKKLNFALEIGHTFILDSTFINHINELNLNLENIKKTNNYFYLIGHEYGHTLQNAIFGPFMIFIWLASCIRYHWWVNFGKSTNYESVWFEKQATNWGYKFFNLE